MEVTYTHIENMSKVSQETVLLVILGEAVWGSWIGERICINYYRISSNLEKYRIPVI